jgi:hypothetical protein
MKGRRNTGGKNSGTRETTNEKWGKLKEDRWKPSKQAILLLL